jgi:hypothetical protein
MNLDVYHLIELQHEQNTQTTPAVCTTCLQQSYYENTKNGGYSLHCRLGNFNSSTLAVIEKLSMLLSPL